MSGLMPAGRLNRRIVLQTATKTQNASTGEEVINWTDAVEVNLPAEWLPASSREAYYASQRLASYVEGVFRIRYRERPSPETHRIIWEGRTYDVKPPIEVGYREGWEIPVVASGEQP